MCFVIAPAWRRRGVARALLDARARDFAARGIALVDAFPCKSGESKPPPTITTGRRAVRVAGFEPIGEQGD